MRTWKWIVGALFGIALAGALLVINLPSILMHYPELMGAMARQDRRWLYQLETDPTEQRNVAEANPERVRELQDRLDAFNREVGPRRFPVLVENPVPIDRTRADPHRPGEEFAYWPN